MYEEKYTLDWTKMIKALSSYKRIGILISIIVMSVLVFGNKFLFPDQYEAVALVRAKMHVVQDDSEGGRTYRERVVQEELLSRAILEQVISNLDLREFSNEKTLIQHGIELVTGRETKQRIPNMDVFIRDLRDEINILEVDANSGGGTNVFSVTMRGKYPSKIASIVNELVNTYIASKASAKAADTNDAIDFLQVQVDKKHEQVMVVTRKLNMFRTANSKYLIPEHEVASALSAAKLRLIEAQANLTQQRALVVSLQETLSAESPIMIGSDVDSDGSRLITNPAELLAQLRGRLTSLQTRFTSTHPEVIRTKEEIRSIERQIAAGAGIRSVNTSISSNRANPEYQRLRSELVMAKAAAQAAGSQVNLIKEELNDLKDKMNKVPKVTQTMTLLETNLTKIEEEYTDLNNRLTDARINSAALKTTAGSNYSILDPAIEPTTPLIRSRLVLYFIGIVAAIMIGFGSALALGLAFPRKSPKIGHAQALVFYSGVVFVVLVNIIYIGIEFVGQLVEFV